MMNWHIQIAKFKKEVSTVIERHFRSIDLIKYLSKSFIFPQKKQKMNTWLVSFHLIESNAYNFLNRVLQSIDFNSDQKMALRSLDVVKCPQVMWTFLRQNVLSTIF